ncbi:hypothetical protein DFH09DRAFT_1098473 [Mycena vulgaris]|nr:hypothetical protein DFH09DRAFT_1098473 [Mycena vulgaris]
MLSHHIPHSRRKHLKIGLRKTVFNNATNSPSSALNNPYGRYLACEGGSVTVTDRTNAASLNIMCADSASSSLASNDVAREAKEGVPLDSREAAAHENGGQMNEWSRASQYVLPFACLTSITYKTDGESQAPVSRAMLTPTPGNLGSTAADDCAVRGRGVHAGEGKAPVVGEMRSYSIRLKQQPKQPKSAEYWTAVIWAIFDGYSAETPRIGRSPDPTGGAALPLANARGARRLSRNPPCVGELGIHSAWDT